MIMSCPLNLALSPFFIVLLLSQTVYLNNIDYGADSVEKYNADRPNKDTVDYKYDRPNNVKSSKFRLTVHEE